MPMLFRSVLALLLLVLAAAAPARAQQGAPPGLALSAIFANENKPISSGLSWRILVEDASGGPPAIVARSDEPTPVFRLQPGAYVVHATYGFASGWKRVTVPQSGALSERVALNAGALKLQGTVGDRPIPANLVTFSVFVPLGGNSEGRLVAEGLRSTDILRLPEGSYHVVSTYGDANAIRRADVRVESGRLVEATLHHRAARATLKLVPRPGGEAFAGTGFTVLTPGGDVIREAIGAFPEVILAEGDYVLIARQEGQVHSREFKIESGLDRDIEVVVGQ